VSKAREDLPDPDNPVITTSLFLGIFTSKFFRLCNAAPVIVIKSLKLLSFNVLGLEYKEGNDKDTK
jgi:hypothetical protein